MPVETRSVRHPEQRAAAHRDRLAPYVEPHLARRARGERHPVHDFLFTYNRQDPRF